MPKKVSYENEQKVMELLGEGNPLTRWEIVDILEIPRSTVYDILERLILKGLVEKFYIPQGPGSPKAYYQERSFSL